MPRNRSEVLSFRANRVEAFETRAAAAERRVPLSEYLRSAVHEVVERDLGPRIEDTPEASQ